VLLAFAGHGYCILRDWTQKSNMNALFKVAVRLLVAANILIALYLSLVHQRGTIDVMDYIREQAHTHSSTTNIQSVDILLPCHWTPLYSHIHHPIPIDILGCPPTGLGLADEQELFFASPDAYLHKKYLLKHLPSHFIFFDKLLPSIKPFLTQNNFTECATFFHAHIVTREWVGQQVLVYTKSTLQL